MQCHFHLMFSVLLRVHRAMAGLMHGCCARSDDTRMLNVSDSMHPIRHAIIGPSPCFIFPFLLLGGKTNKVCSQAVFAMSCGFDWCMHLHCTQDYVRRLASGMALSQLMHLSCMADMYLFCYMRMPGGLTLSS